MATKAKKKPVKEKAKRSAPAPAAPAKLWFKVIRNGESFHSGRHTWSLPVDGKPGQWHEIPADKKLSLCSVGFHLTDKPAAWWADKCTAYIVEIEGETTDYKEDGGKIAARKVRLVRPATVAELTAHNVFTEGQHEVATGIHAATGSASVKAYDSASVTATGSASVKAYDSASVTAYGSASVTAYGSASVKAYGSASVKAESKTTVMKYSLSAKVSILGFAIEIDWTEDKAKVNRAKENA